MFFWTLRKRFFTGFVKNACIGVHGNIFNGNKFSWKVPKHVVFYRFLTRSVWMVFLELICTCMQRLFGPKQLRFLEHAHQFSGFQRKLFQCFRLALKFFSKEVSVIIFLQILRLFFSCCSKWILHSRGNRLLFFPEKFSNSVFLFLDHRTIDWCSPYWYLGVHRNFWEEVFLRKRLIYWNFPSWEFFLAGVPRNGFYVQWV